MSNLDDLYTESGIKAKHRYFVKFSYLKWILLMVLYFGIIYWAFTTEVFGDNKSQPYYFIVIVSVLFFLVFKKTGRFLKENKKFLGF